MRKHARIVGFVIACLVAGAGVLLASNMGFFVAYSLLGEDGSASGTNWMSLPYRTASDLVTASDLFEDLGGAPAVISVSRWDPQTDSLQTYTGGTENDFPLTAGEGVIVRLTTSTDYEIIGTHDPTVTVTLLGPESSLTGTNQYSVPYNAEATSASELINDIGFSSVDSVQRLLRADDTIESYTGRRGSPGEDFPLVRGESYRVLVNRTVEYKPDVID